MNLPRLERECPDLVPPGTTAAMYNANSETGMHGPRCFWCLQMFPKLGTVNVKDIRTYTFNEYMQIHNHSPFSGPGRVIYKNGTECIEHHLAKCWAGWRKLREYRETRGSNFDWVVEPITDVEHIELLDKSKATAAARMDSGSSPASG